MVPGQLALTLAQLAILATPVTSEPGHDALAPSPYPPLPIWVFMASSSTLEWETSQHPDWVWHCIWGNQMWRMDIALWTGTEQHLGATHPGQSGPKWNEWLVVANDSGGRGTGEAQQPRTQRRLIPAQSDASNCPLGNRGIKRNDSDENLRGRPEFFVSFALFIYEVPECVTIIIDAITELCVIKPLKTDQNNSKGGSYVRLIQKNIVQQLSWC